MADFAWRISGKTIDTSGNFDPAKNAVDGIIERVISILDMLPDNFRIDIYLHPTYATGQIAFYDNKTKSITVYADKVTDGVLAHEIAHAVINAYFDIPPPKKIQEILAQYVDRHLWSDY